MEINSTKGFSKPLALGLILALPLILTISFGIIAKRREMARAPTSSSPADIAANAAGAKTGLPRIDWKKLRELDLDSGKAPEDLQSLDGKLIQVPGFMVPLEDNKQDITDFLLVPNPQACIHIPAPPANQIVLVRMAGGNTARVLSDPIWVTGYFHISTVSHAYGKASYYMEAQGTEVYRE